MACRMILALGWQGLSVFTPCFYLMQAYGLGNLVPPARIITDDHKFESHTCSFGGDGDGDGGGWIPAW